MNSFDYAKLADSTTKAMPCTCVHAQQDKMYGPGKRLHNRMADGRWRCTVCGGKS